MNAATSYCVTPNPNDANGTGLPVGAITMWSTASAPSQWLLCDGSAVNRTTYASLFSVIGTSYGIGDGSTTFNVPDATDRVVRGLGATFNPIGAKAGADSVTLTSDNLAEHTHSITDPGHFHTFLQNVYNGEGSGGGQYQGNGQDPGPPNGYTFYTGSPAGTREFTNISNTNVNSTAVTPVKTVNQYLVLNYIIKAY